MQGFVQAGKEQPDAQKTSRYYLWLNPCGSVSFIENWDARQDEARNPVNKAHIGT